MPKINSLEVVHQDTNKDSYQNLHDILVALNKSLALEKEVVDGDARVAIENLLEMYVNDKEAFLRSLQVLTAQFKESQAQFSEEILLKASELEALARRITSLSAAVANSNAAIYQEQTVRATADEAFASDITTLSATIGSKNRTYYQSTAPSTSLVTGDLWIDSDDDRLYRWNGSSWTDVQDNQIGVNTAAITNEATTRATADSANATAINAVTARLDTGDFATVKTQAAASVSKATVYAQTTAPSGGTYVTGDLWIDIDADNKMYRWNGTSWVFSDTSSIKTFSQTTAPTAINTGDLWIDTDDSNKLYRWSGSSWVLQADNRITSIEAKWGVTTDVNGYVAGIQLLNGGSTSSSFTVAANKFIVKKPDGTNGIAWNGTNSRLDISGDIYANSFYGNVIGTGNINNNAVTVPAKFSFGSAAAAGSTFSGSFVLPDAAYVTILVTAVQPNDNGLYKDNTGTGFDFGAATCDIFYPISIATRYILTIDGTSVFAENPNNSFGIVTSFSGSKQITSAGTKTFSLDVLPLGWPSFVDAGCIPRNITVYVLASVR